MGLTVNQWIAGSDAQMRSFYFGLFVYWLLSTVVSRRKRVRFPHRSLTCIAQRLEQLVNGRLDRVRIPSESKFIGGGDGRCCQRVLTPSTLQVRVLHLLLYIA